MKKKIVVHYKYEGPNPLSTEDIDNLAPWNGRVVEKLSDIHLPGDELTFYGKMRAPRVFKVIRRAAMYSKEGIEVYVILGSPI